MVDKKVTLEIHHGGFFGLHVRHYAGGRGNLHVVRNIDPDCLSYIELLAIMKDIGYAENCLMYYNMPNQDIADGLVLLTSDTMVLEMVKNHKNSDTFEMYVEENLMDSNIDAGVNVGDMGSIGSCIVGRDGDTIRNNTKGDEGVVVHIIDEPAEDIVEGDKSEEDSDSDRTYSPESDEEFFSEGDLEYFADGDKLSDSCEDVYELLGNQLNSESREVDEPYIDHAIIEKIHSDPYYGKCKGLHEEGVQSDPEELSVDNMAKMDAPNDDIEWFSEETDMEDPVLFTGLGFSSAQLFRKALRQHAIKEGFELGFEKNESDRVTAFCKKKCGWRIHASFWKKTTAFQIKTLYGMPHRCPRVLKNKTVNSTWIANRYMKDLLDEPNWSIHGFRRMVKRNSKVVISKKQSYRARKMAEEWIKGNFYEQFHRVRDYCEIVLKQNPGSAAFLCLSRSRLQQLPTFKRMFVMFSALREGFLLGCRPMIGLDACFLKGLLGGQLMAAIARDGNNQMFPLAVAVVESECKDSWTWFLESLIDQIGMPKEKGWTFISDRQKGLLESFKKVMPDVDHRFCVRHMYANFKLRFKDQKLKDLMWAAARSYTIVDFEKHMELIKKENAEAHRWLSKIEANQWSKSAFSTLPKCDMLSNNICEIFNHWIDEARDQPILTMLEIIRRKLMCRLQERCEWIKKYDGIVCPRIMEKIEEIKGKTLDCEPIEAGNGNWEVHEGLQVYVTKLNERVCSCREWDITGIPCRHGLSAILIANREPEDFVHPCYHISTFKKAYSGTIIPIPDQSQWDNALGDPILPPEPLDRKPGRPRKSRKKCLDEPINPSKVRKFGYHHECSNCHEIGHNKITCKNSSKPRPKKNVQKSGRSSNRGSEYNTLHTNPEGRGRGIGIEMNGRGYDRQATSALVANNQGRGETTHQRSRGIADVANNQGWGETTNQRSRGRARGMGRQNRLGPNCGIGNWNGVGMSNINHFVPASQVQPPRPSRITSSATQPSTSQLHRQSTPFGDVIFSTQASATGRLVQNDGGYSSSEWDGVLDFASRMLG